MIIKKVCLGILISLLLLAAYAVQAGIAIVDVKTPEARIWIPFPVVLGHLVGEFIDLPIAKDKEFREIMEYREIAARILRQIQDLPDADFVEIHKSSEHVRIYKRQDALWVDVNEAQEKVRARIPFSMVEKVIAVLESRDATVGDLVSCLEWQKSGELVYVESGNEKVRISIL